MVTTDWHYPTTISITDINQGTHWTDITKIINNPIWSGAATGSSDTNHPHGYMPIPGHKESDYPVASGYGFSIPSNAQIDGLQALIVRSGGYVKDWHVCIIQNGSWLANKCTKYQRTDGNLIVQQYGSPTDKWGSSNLTPAIINSPSALAFFIGLCADQDSSSMTWLHVMGLKVSHTNPIYSLISTYPSTALLNSNISYKITITSTNGADQGVGIPVSIPIPSGFTFNDYSSVEGTYDSSTHTWTPILNSNKTATITLILTATTAGTQSQTVTENDFNTTLTKSCNIVTSDPGEIGYVDATITDTSVLNTLKNGTTYTITGYNKITDTNQTGVFSGIKNNRIGIINGNTSNYGSSISQIGNYEQLSCSFTYDSSQALKIRLYGQYQSVSTTEYEYWGKICIKEGNDLIYEIPENLFSRPQSFIDGTITSTVKLTTGESSGEYKIVYDAIPSQGNDAFFTGIEVDIVTTTISNSEFEIYLVTEDGEISNKKTQTFTSDNTSITFGGDGDLWGLTNSEFVEKELTVVLKAKNISLSTIDITISEVNLNLYWQNDVTQGAIGYTYNDEHSKIYGVTLLDVSHPKGTDGDLTTLSIPKKDGFIITNQVIKGKEIEITFLVFGSTLEEAFSNLTTVTQWLSNERNVLDLPISKELIFDYEPDIIYNAILEDIITVDINYTTLKCKTKFLIPSGVGFTSDMKITGSVGTNEGLTKVRPVLNVLTNGSSSITITESESNQYITINSTITSETILTVDCDNRVIYDANGIIYTNLDLNSIWFNLKGDYSFSCTGGIVQNVAYKEGY